MNTATPDRERHGDDQCQSRRNQSAVYEWQRAVLIVDRIPFAAEKEFQAKGVPGKVRLSNQFVNDKADDGDHG